MGLARLARGNIRLFRRRLGMGAGGRLGRRRRSVGGGKLC